LILLVILIFILGGYVFKNDGELIEAPSEENQKINIEEEFCSDCGQGGWEKMNEKCNEEVLNKDDFKKCLMEFSWSNVDADTNFEETKEGYIEVNGTKILNDPSVNSIKIIKYNQWAVDEEGNLYLLGELG
ncbi:hypothetical protein KKC45_00810, partial [Patescibacteria group bacterium]|nr:hypothetical protein [Patescibacteria group bacterium]